jgi:ABC-type amino acid transport substrate-binding protein
MSRILLSILIFVFTLPAFAADKESAFDRVMRTGTIRCGYIVYDTYFIKDPNSGKISGIFPDIMEEVGRLLSLKVDWSKESGLATLTSDLNSHKIDAICSGLWANAARGRVGEFSRPLFYNTLNVYVRSKDKRFDENLEELNNTSIKIAVIDGEMGEQITNVDFPKASKLSLPQLTDFSQLLLSVAAGKADATIAGTAEVSNYLDHNQGSLRVVGHSEPIRTFSNILMYDKGEHNLRTMIDSAINEMDSTGKLNKIIAKYEKVPNSYYRVAKPFNEFIE